MSSNCGTGLLFILACTSLRRPSGFTPSFSTSSRHQSFLRSLLVRAKASSSRLNYSPKDSPDPRGFDVNETMSEDDPMFDDYCEIVDDFGCEAFEETFNFELQGGEEVIDPQSSRWVRVEAKPDETIGGIRTKKDVFNQIALARQTLASLGPSELYERQWEKFEDSTSSDDKVNGTEHSIRVMQFNVLAEGLSSSNSIKTPFSKSDGIGETQAFGGFTDIIEPAASLDFSLRRWRLVEVILGGSIKNFDSSSFDIVALEEIDRFRGFFLPILRIFGYSGIFMPKARAPGLRFGWYSDGCALFWKTNVFDIVSERRLHYKSGNQVILLVALRHRASLRLILVAVTHLKAQKSDKNELIRCAQVDELLERVRNEEKRLAANGDVATLIIGDFNSEPPCEITGGDSSVRHVLDSSLRSAYPIDPPSNDFYTTWKTRGKNTFRRVIDYIFHGTGLKCKAILSVPAESEMEAAKLPGLRHPSDHMMIAAEFELD